ncbi:MAG: DHH family phosphoesterase [Odoribacter sp.]|nr:DHH family phosphoesterase [Odoribacter sp.]
MIEEEIERLKKRLETKGLKTIIIPHISADGDAVGACSALYSALAKNGIDTHIISCDHLPAYLKWLKNIDKAIACPDNSKECKRLIEEADIIFMIDHNTFKREGKLENWVISAKAEKVMIDHHPDPEIVDYTISKPEVSSTCELLYYVISEIWGRSSIDKDMANALYTGINTDTGGLSHNSSCPSTYEVIAELLKLGMDKEYVHERLYQMNKLSRFRLIGDVLLNQLEIDTEFPLALIPITLEELEIYSYEDGDLEGVVNIPLSIENICVSIQITQRKERIKLSFRSKGDVQVNECARVHFNGGGHLNAAGGQMDLPMEDVLQRIEETKEWFFTTYVNVVTE